jgi:hypothetical protein
MKYYALRHKDTKLYYLCGDSILNTLVEEVCSACLYHSKYDVDFYLDHCKNIVIQELSEIHIPYFENYEKKKVWKADCDYSYFIPVSEFEIVEFELIEILK